MSDFVKKAVSKIDKLSDEQIKNVIGDLEQKLNVCENVLDTSDYGYLLVNSQFKVVYFNNFFSDVLGIYKKNRQCSVKTFFQDAELISFISESIKKKSIDGEFFFDTHNSLYGDMEIRVASRKVRDNDIMLFIFSDYTFIRHIYNQFRRNESLAALTTMAAGVAHEIKNPLASMSIYIQLLQRKLHSNGSVTEDEAKDSLQVISDEIERLNKMAVDFLFAVKPLNYSPVLMNLNDCVSKIASVAKAEAESMNISIVLNTATTLPNVMADNSLMQQCLLNLIRNAMQAIEVTGHEGIIRISTFIEDNCVKISVADNGCGMSEEVMNKIFEPYYTTKASGTGLGLTNIFKIIKEHEGDISVNSTENEGSVFTVSIPVPKSERFRIQ